MKNMTVDTQKYAEFVNAVTSNESKGSDAFTVRLRELYSEGLPVERLLTAAVGMSAESGEFTEIIKKILFQGKPVNEENLFHLKRELGDVMWYCAMLAKEVDMNLGRIMEENLDKLADRKARNRLQGDGDNR